MIQLVQVQYMLCVEFGVSTQLANAVYEVWLLNNEIARAEYVLEG